VRHGLSKLLILLALVPTSAVPLVAQHTSTDQPDSGFGPVDTSAPPRSRTRSSSSLPPRKPSFATRWITTPTNGMCASRHQR